ncbi:MAG: DUF2339 domain-containing protein [Helicobacteraceae bacterium]|jgi:uncharacterized membrane protein|nr:DUF2339 domain-containing protein [Helicobacteraceae bacterium]
MEIAALVLLGIGVAVFYVVAPIVLFARMGDLKNNISWLERRLSDLIAHFNREVKNLNERIASLEAKNSAPETPETSQKTAYTVQAASQTPLAVKTESAKASQTIAAAYDCENAEQPSASDQTPPAISAERAVDREQAEQTEQVKTESSYSYDRERIKPDQPRPLEGEPNDLERAITAIKNWALGGNAILRAGAALLFIGLAFLLRYASERFSLSINARYVCAALIALALLQFGWRLRLKRPEYGLTLQGASVAMLYLIVFAAMRVHSLLPPEAAFALLAALTVCAVVLALIQDSSALACAAAMGGFAAPILASTGSGNHIALFSYFAVLDAGLIAIAWFKAWRALNLIGFAGSFGIGFAWGLRSYSPDLFATTQPFLALFFVAFVVVGLLFARRKLIEANASQTPSLAIKNADYIDAVILFAPPLIGFGMQCAIIKHIEYGMAFSALILGLFYLLAALALRGKSELTLLREIALALGVIFVSLAIPLALDPQWTSAAWAVEGAGVYWVGFKQSRRLSRGFATLLIFGSAVAFLIDTNIFADRGASFLAPWFAAQSGKPFLSSHDAVLSGSPLGSAMLGCALIFCFLIARKAAQSLSEWERNIKPLFAVSGLIFIYLIAPFGFNIDYTLLCWQAAALATVAAGIKLRSPVFLFCAATLWAVSGASYFVSRADMIVETIVYGAVADGAYSAIFNLDFAIALAIALSGFAGAYLARLSDEQEIASAAQYRSTLAAFANIALGWSVAWFAFAALGEAARNAYLVDPSGEWAAAWSRHTALLAICVLSAFWTAFAKAASWRSLAIACLIPLAAAIVLLVTDGVLPFKAIVFMANGGSLALTTIVLAWIALFGAHYFALSRLEKLLPPITLSAAHTLIAAALVAVLSFSARDFAAHITEANSAWRWIAWAIFPSLYLLIVSASRVKFYPIGGFSKEYRLYAALPVLAAALSWFWLANIFSAGECDPLSYLPIVNPLEIALIAAALVALRWVTARLTDLGDLGFDAQQIKLASALALGASALALCTAAVCRAAYHFGGVRYDFASMFSETGVQAGWSIIWTLLALATMIGATRVANRSLWIAGAALIGVVALKLFLVEMSDQGSLARVVSFMGVGALLLIVGYFSPLPPRENR